MAHQELMMSPLSALEIQNLNESEPLLDEEGYYLKVFIINDKQNKAADPSPFKISPGALTRIVDSVLGRPFIVGPDPTKHVRGATGTAEDIIQDQKKWAVGEFVRTFINAFSHNAYGIVSVFPEFIQELKEGRIRGAALPRHSSPLLEVRATDKEGQVTDGRILHVQAVDSPGYDPEVAKITGSCEGMLKECMAELRHLGGSGKLKAWQANLIFGASSEDIFSSFDNDKDRNVDYTEVMEFVRSHNPYWRGHR